MNVGDPEHHHLNDDQLDALLAAADRELLQHIQTEADPTATLLAVMTGTAAEASVPPPRQSERGARKHHDHTAGQITWRFNVRRLARDVEVAYRLACELTPICDRHLALSIYNLLERVLDLDLNLDLDRGLFDVLTCARDQARYLADNLVLGLDRERVPALVRNLFSARRRARDLSLVGGEIDASGADLSRLEIDDLDLVAGVVWTAGTVWPPELRSRILARSREICAGVFQVSNGTERTSLFTDR
ncbi:hypothetical protein [Amycolatopsis sp. NBC_00438]|uniref:hypothetical protein n=1 Tax=Amycolatopsis sp. NBC_00438 TaxID=2903558 RepID=UPI002E1D1632